MATNYIKYTSRIKSSTADGVLLEADQMKDESQGKLQSAINQEVKTGLGTKANAADVYKKTETYTKSEVDTKVSQAVSTVYKYMGSKNTIAEVIALTDAKNGHVWDVKTEFTLSGKKYPAGTNVACVTDTTTSAHTDANWDALGGTIDLSPYAKTADVTTQLASKVDKVSGKSLSTNDYTTAEKTKLAGIAAGAQVNTVTSVAGKTGAVKLAKTDVGLDNADNTSDLDKPISTATQEVLDLKADTTDVTASLATKVDKVTGKGLSTNDYTTAEKTKLSGIAAGAQVNSVTSVAGRTGAVALTKTDVGLANVDNTSDASKPISTATQTALNAKANAADVYKKTETYTRSEVDTKVSQAVSTVYKYMGSKDTIAEVIALTDAKNGHVWDVKTEFTLSGKKYPAGTNVACVTATTTSAHTEANWDALGGTVDLTPYEKTADVNTKLASKVDKITGKGLSTNDYTTTEKNKLAGIAAGAQVNTVTSVAGKTGAVALTKADVGLSAVDNTSDAGKPISTKTQAALDLKVDKVTGKGLSTNDYTAVDKKKVNTLVGCTLTGTSDETALVGLTLPEPDKLSLFFNFKSVDTGSSRQRIVNFPAATAEEAGVMSAADKGKLDKIPLTNKYDAILLLSLNKNASSDDIIQAFTPIGSLQMEIPKIGDLLVIDDENYMSFSSSSKTDDSSVIYISFTIFVGTELLILQMKKDKTTELWSITSSDIVDLIGIQKALTLE